MDIEDAASQIGANLFGSGGDLAVESEPTPVENSTPATDNPDVGTPTDTAETESAAETTPPADKAETETTPPAETTTPVGRPAPKTWRDGAAAMWESLPEQVKDEVLKREEDIFKGIEQYKGDAFLGKELKNILQPHMEIFQKYNVHPGNHIAQLLQTQRTLMEGTPAQKQEVLRRIASDYGVQLDEFDEAPYVDPATEAMRQELSQLRSQFSELTAAQQATRLQEVSTSVEKFASDSKNIYFSEVINDMTDLINGKVCKTIEEAYDLAVWRNPATRAKEQQRLQTEAAEKLKQESAAHAAKAAKATAVRVTPPSRAVGETAPLGTMADTIAATLQEIQSRRNR